MLDAPNENSLPKQKLDRIEQEKKYAESVATVKIALIGSIGVLVVYLVSKNLALTGLVLSACIVGWLFTFWQIRAAADIEHERTRGERNR